MTSGQFVKMSVTVTDNSAFQDTLTRTITLDDKQIIIITGFCALKKLPTVIKLFSNGPKYFMAAAMLTTTQQAHYTSTTVY